MDIDGWRYYNHAAIPTCAPHEVPNTVPVNDGTIWKMGGGRPLLARWVEDFDCGYETNWWYCIRDGKFSIDELSKSARKHIRQAQKSNIVIRTKIEDSLLEELYKVYVEATSHYKHADNLLNEQEFYDGLKKRCDDLDLFLAFDINKKIIAYITVRPENNWAEIETAKFGDRALEIQSSNALYFYLLNYYLNDCNDLYVSSGARSINHETGTQDYKERVFGYRKAYCHLNIKYRPSVLLLIKTLYPLRHILQKLEFSTKIHQLNSVLKMEEIVKAK